jgi:hypothetical protein
VARIEALEAYLRPRVPEAPETNIMNFEPKAGSPP